MAGLNSRLQIQLQQPYHSRGAVKVNILIWKSSHLFTLDVGLLGIFAADVVVDAGVVLAGAGRQHLSGGRNQISDY